MLRKLIFFLLITSTLAVVKQVMAMPIAIDPGSRILPPEPTLKGCVTGGCSGEICAEAGNGPINSICIYREEYACLKHARCERQSDGNCGWTYTGEYHACIGGVNPTVAPVTVAPAPTSTPAPVIPTKAPVCGNHVCEMNEYIPCPPGAQCIWAGSCPQDCTDPQPTLSHLPVPTSTPTLKPTCFPRPACLDADPPCQMMPPRDGTFHWCPPVKPSVTPVTPDLTPTPRATPPAIITIPPQPWIPIMPVIIFFKAISAASHLLFR